MLEESTKAKLRAWIDSAERPVILTHTNPDGDAIGSSLALALALRKLGKDARVIIPDGLPDFLRWLPGIELSTTFAYKKEKAAALMDAADLIFCLDFNEPRRLNGLDELLDKSKAKRILIDHHEDPGDFCDLTIVETWRGSVGEMIYVFLKELYDEQLFDRDVATCLYTAIMTDTGNFNFASSYPEIFRIVGELLRFGIDKDGIFSAVYDAYTEDRMRLQGYCMQEKMVVIPEYHTAYISLTAEELKRFNHRKGDTEGFVNIPFGIKGIRFTALFLEKKDLIKASFRSRGNFPANQVAAAHFSGGGHVNAAGGESRLSLEETLASFEALLPAYGKLLKTGME